jgi:DNA-binding CsgD family transcriptional regulator
VSVWRRRGHELGFGSGIDLGYATLGTMGLEGRTEYGAIGPVLHLAVRLRDAAQAGQVVISQRVQSAVEPRVECTSLGELSVAGLGRPARVFAAERLRRKLAETTAPAATAQDQPLTARERDIAALATRGYTNRQIGEALLLPEASVVRHVANILNKLGMSSRAEIADWASDQGLLPDGLASFGALLRKYRLAAGLSQGELAERAGLSPRGISDLERGERRAPYPATVRQLAEALGLGEAERAALLAASRSPGMPQDGTATP